MEELFRDVIREDLLAEFNRGMEKGLPQEKIDLNIKYLKRQLEEKYGIPFSKAEGGEIYKGVGSLNEVARNMNNGGEANRSKTEFANQLINAAVNAKGVRRDAKQKFLDGNYAEAIEDSLLGMSASLPVYKQILAGVGQAILDADEQGDISFTNLMKNLLNSENSISFMKEKINFANGGEARSLDAEVEALIPAIIQTESNNDPRAVSEDGAIGLMQVLPETAMKPGYGVPNIFDIAREQGFDVPEESIGMAKKLLFSPDLNVDFGARYMKAMRRNFDTMEDALRAYNAGPGNFNKYLKSGRDLNSLDSEAVNYPLKVAAANQGINPNEPAEYERFSDSPEAFSTFMETASEERPMRVPRPPLRPTMGERLFTPPAPPQMPSSTQEEQDQKEVIEETVRDVVKRQPLQEKYSMKGIEQMLTGTIGESLLPRLFQRD